MAPAFASSTVSPMCLLLILSPEEAEALLLFNTSVLCWALCCQKDVGGQECVQRGAAELEGSGATVLWGVAEGVGWVGLEQRRLRGGLAAPHSS